MAQSSDVWQLWCWISPNWGPLRLYSYYIPIWICILLSIIAYTAVGWRVFHTRNQLNIAMGGPGQHQQPQLGSDESGPEARHASTMSLVDFLRADLFIQSVVRRRDVYGTVVTEVQVTTASDHGAASNFLGAPRGTETAGALPSLGPSASWTMLLPHDAAPSHDGQPQLFETICTSNSQPPPRLSVRDRLRAAASQASAKLRRLDPVKMAYLRTSSIFALAVLITWIPSSLNRVYSLANGGKISFPLSVASGCVLPLQGLWNNIIYLTTS